MRNAWVDGAFTFALGVLVGAIGAKLSGAGWMFWAMTFCAFVIGGGSGVIATLVFISSAEAERQSRAVAEEHHKWHHPKETP